MTQAGIELVPVERAAGSLVAVTNQCEAVEAWAVQCESIPELRDANNKLAAISEYLDRTSIEGRGRVAAAMRRLEMRIGQLLPREQGRRTDQLPPRAEEVPLSTQRKAEFRQMAEQPEVVEKVIAESTDEAPASRRKVVEAIAKPRRSALADDARNAGWQIRKAAERVARVKDDDRFTSNRKQVAAELRDHLLYTVEVCQDLLNSVKETT